MIRHIVFDMGNVILDFNGYDIMRGYLPEPVNEDDLQRMIDACFTSGLWLTLDTGETAEEADLVEPICALLPERLHPAMRNMLLHWHKHLKLRDDTFHLMKELKQRGYHLYLLSNAGRTWEKYAPSVPAFRFLDGHIVSAFVRQIKPYPDIYHTLFRTFDLNPAECVFIDDVKANIDAGKALGMDGIVFDGNMTELRYELAARGVQVNTSPEFSLVVCGTRQIEMVSALRNEMPLGYIPPQKDLEEKLRAVVVQNDIIEAQIAEQGSEIYLIEQNGEAIGFFRVRENDLKFWIKELYIREPYRHRGYGKAAVAFALSMAENRGFASLSIVVDVHEPQVIELFRHMGFITVRHRNTKLTHKVSIEEEVMELSI